MSGFLTGSNCLVILTLIIDEESTVASSMIVTHPGYGYKLPPGVLSVANRDMNDDSNLSSCRPAGYLPGLIVQDDEIESEEDAESNEEDQEDEQYEEDEDTMSE